MIQVNIPKDNRLEREYVVSVLLKEFLGLEYSINITDEPVYQFILPNGKEVIISDAFFSYYPVEKSYLQEKALPSSIKTLTHDFIAYPNLPILFGDGEIVIEEEKIICKADLFSGAFFMLTRWEEYVNPLRDNHKRFSAYDSIAYKANFLTRAIVDEYAMLLQRMFECLGYENNFNKYIPRLYITHDIDDISTYQSCYHAFKVFMREIIRNKDIKSAIFKLKEYIQYSIFEKKDPVDTFSKLMDISEQNGLKSHFYIMSGGVTEYDNRFNIYSKKAKKIIKEIKERGHIIGIHPSYNSYNSKKLFSYERDVLQKVSGCEIKESRQHYLRFEVPTTWQLLVDSGMKLDSTCSYADAIGFRCGTGREYSVFNILTRQILSLKERPLIVMDASLFSYNSLSYEESKKLINEMREYSDVTILWHNSYIKHFDFYETFMKGLKK